MANSRRRRSRGADWFIARLLVVLSLFAAFVFAVSVISTGMLPLKFVLVVIAALVLLVLLVALLTWNPRYRVRYVLGLILAVVFCVALGIGTVYVFKTISTAKTVTTTKVETAAVGIYVPIEDANDFATVAAGYTYGILADQDRENTDDAIAQINSEFGISLSVRAYEGLPRLIDGLFNHEVDAIIVNSAYLGLLSEMEGYENAASRLREVHMAHVEREVEVTVTPDGEEVPADRLTGMTDINAVSDAADTPDGLIFTMFISGIDTRGELTDRSRSDVNIIASVNTATKQVALISTPRDFYVPLSISGGARDKLTHAGIYGVQVCMDTMAMLYNVNVDYYFRVNFWGFEDIIDALGGVEAYSEYSFSTDNYYFDEGYNYMDGAKALEFVRERYAFASGDRQRGKNQMAVIKACIDKALSPDMLLNYSNVLNAVEGSFETSIPYDTLSSIVRDQLDNGGEWNIVSYSVDGYGDSQIPYSMSLYAYVMVPYEDTVEAAKNMIYQVYTGQTVTAP